MTVELTNRESIECEAIDLVLRIKGGEKFHDNSDGWNGQRLSTLLTQSGFKPYSTGSRCKVASFEVDLEKNGTRVSIVESDFFGKFTLVKVT